MAGELHARTGLRVDVGNDANLGAIAEHRFGVARGIDDFVYVMLSDGVGAGLAAVRHHGLLTSPPRGDVPAPVRPPGAPAPAANALMIGGAATGATAQVEPAAVGGRRPQNVSGGT